MKIATYKDGSRDGQLLVVSRDLTMAHYATGIASRLQQLLDDWNFLSPQLEELSQSLNHGKARHAFAFDPRMCAAPLPRASFLALADPAAEAGDEQRPLIRLARSDELLGAREALTLPEQPPAAELETPPDLANQPGLEFRARLAVITGDLRAATAAQDALAAVRLMSLACSWHLHAEESQEPDSVWASSFAPVVVTLDELGAAWNDGRVELDLQIGRNGKAHAVCNAGTGAHIGEVLARCVARRGLRSASIVGVGLASGRGFVAGGETLHLDIDGRDGQSIFGAIAAPCEEATSRAPTR